MGQSVHVSLLNLAFPDFSTSGYFVVNFFFYLIFFSIVSRKMCFTFFLNVFSSFIQGQEWILVLWGLKLSKWGVVLFKKKNVKILT